MPYYYLIPEVPDEPDRKTSYTYKKPLPCNLLLPSIHASRDDNVLAADNNDNDTKQAVEYLRSSNRDSNCWPSSNYTETEHEQDPYLECQNTTGCVYEVDIGLNLTSQESPQLGLSKGPGHPKSRAPFWAYDTVQPHVIDAARALFFERKRQQAFYETFPSWNNMSGMHRTPTDYELFTTWACLPRSEKMLYVSEVSGHSSAYPHSTNTLETQRAVNALYASCPSSMSWPSSQYLRQPPHSPRNTPRTFVLNNPLPYRFN